MTKKLIIAVILRLLVTACSTSLPEPVETATQVIDGTPTFTTTATELPTGTPTPKPSATPTPTPTPTLVYPEEGFGPTGFPDDVNPLTGLYVSDEEILQRRPVAVKINIVPRNNRPPWGISLADIVFDYYHNDGYTRLHAIYYGQDAELVGPIRSGRLPDGPLVQMFHSIFAYSGADWRIDNRLRNSGFSDRLVLEGQRSPCPPTAEDPMCREEPNRYDFLLGGTEQIHAYAELRGIDDSLQNLEGMRFQMQPPAGGKPAESVTTRYSIDNYNRWDYDLKSRSYLRFQDDLLLDQGQEEEFQPMTDRLTEEQVSAANVVVLLVPHSYFKRSPGEIIEINFSGSGPGYAFRDGKAYEVLWNHPSADSVMFLTLSNGERYPFKPGNTWFQVTGQYSLVTNPENGNWRFQFMIP